MSIATDLERAMLEMLNSARAENGLGALTLELDLNASAEAHSLWMLETDVFSHTGVDGSNVSDRIRDAGLDLSGGWSVAENIAVQSARGAAGFEDDVQNLHDALMNSPGHRANILNGSYDHVGIGIEIGSFTYSSGVTMTSVVVTQNFAYTGGSVSPDVIEPAPAPVPAPAPEPDPVPEPEPEPLAPAGPTAGEDVLAGTSGDDRIEARAGDDRLSGGAGADWLMGEAGDDTLEGGAGNDILIGGAGRDLLIGGAGADVFAFERAAGTENDVIADFDRGEDRIWIDADLLGVSQGVLDLSYTELGAVARQSDTRLLYDPKTGIVRIDADGAGGAEAEILFTFDDSAQPLVSDVLLG